MRRISGGSIEKLSRCRNKGPILGVKPWGMRIIYRSGSIRCTEENNPENRVESIHSSDETLVIWTGRRG
ncbi:hypothetical protein [Pasteuria penetrans]|uniref:hypothetical protein n=1 Tax=Pasteuria penetrans TaxID=86005 RepID=UPI000FBEF130|nr:hypothetical protein [Pasteuria penetrans]